MPGLACCPRELLRGLQLLPLRQRRLLQAHGHV
jgi:hypothetical protein